MYRNREESAGVKDSEAPGDGTVTEWSSLCRSIACRHEIQYKFYGVGQWKKQLCLPSWQPLNFLFDQWSDDPKISNDQIFGGEGYHISPCRYLTKNENTLMLLLCLELWMTWHGLLIKRLPLWWKVCFSC